MEISRNSELEIRENTPSEKSVEQISSSNSTDFWRNVLKTSGGSEEPKAHPPAKRHRDQSFQEALTPSKKFAPETPQANFDAYMDTSGSAGPKGGDWFERETPPAPQWSNREYTPTQDMEYEDPQIWDEWAVEMENQIKDAKEQMERVKEDMISKLEGIKEQTRYQKREMEEK